MTKNEAKIFLDKKAAEGFTTKSTLLHLYNDTEDITEDMLTIMYSEPLLVDKELEHYNFINIEP